MLSLCLSRSGAQLGMAAQDARHTALPAGRQARKSFSGGSLASPQLGHSAAPTRLLRPQGRPHPTPAAAHQGAQCSVACCISTHVRGLCIGGGRARWLVSIHHPGPRPAHTRRAVPHPPPGLPAAAAPAPRRKPRLRSELVHAHAQQAFTSTSGGVAARLLPPRGGIPVAGARQHPGPPTPGHLIFLT